MSGSGKGSEGRRSKGEREKGGCVRCSLMGDIWSEKWGSEGARQTLGGDGSRQREQWVRRAWGGDVSGFFKELVLVGLEQRALGANDRGESCGESRDPRQDFEYEEHACENVQLTLELLGNEKCQHPPPPGPCIWKSTVCYLCLKKNKQTKKKRWGGRWNGEELINDLPKGEKLKQFGYFQVSNPSSFDLTYCDLYSNANVSLCLVNLKIRKMKMGAC